MNKLLNIAAQPAHTRQLHQIFSIIAVCWLLLCANLMIADVWDESTFLLALRSQPYVELPLSELLLSLWTQRLGDIYRPLPSSIGVLINALLQDYDTTWRVMRGLNMLLLVAAFYLLNLSLKRWRTLSIADTLLLNLLLFYAGGAIIAAGWFANIFDVSCLFFISLGIYLLSGRHLIIGGLALGAAFFCKEIAAMIFPLLAALYVNRILNLAESIKVGSIVFSCAFVYGAIRVSLIATGSESDIHGFAPEHFLTTLTTLAGSFWLQGLKSPALFWPGIGVLLLTILLPNLWLNKGIIAGVFLLSVFAYWGQVSYHQDIMVAGNFASRFYLVPATVVLMILMFDGKRHLLVMSLIFPLSLWGAWQTWHNHYRFQQVYADIYQLAENTDSTVHIYYPLRPTNDFRRNIVIGETPTVPWMIDQQNARLVRKEN